MPWSTLRYLLSLASVMLRYRLHHLIVAEHIPNAAVRGLLGMLRFALPARENMPNQLAEALASRGPAYIKMGQLLSTRPDLLGASMCRGLAKLQDQVDPLPDDTALTLMHSALSQSGLAEFAHIDAQPIASASRISLAWRMVSQSDWLPMQIAIFVEDNEGDDADMVGTQKNDKGKKGGAGLSDDIWYDKGL